MTMTKAELRKAIRAMKNQTGSDELRQMSGRVVERLKQHPAFVNAHVVLLYHSLPDEVFTHDLLAEYADSKTILLPTVVGDDLQLHVFQPDALHTGAFGIMESAGKPFTRFSDIDLAIIPGMAFDKEGHRLGRGRGFYDRLLPSLPCKKIGLCFPFQFVDAVPSDPHDISVDEVIC